MQRKGYKIDLRNTGGMLAATVYRVVRESDGMCIATGTGIDSRAVKARIADLVIADRARQASRRAL